MQAQVDTFTYTEVTGTLEISGSDITNLDGLGRLPSVRADLIVIANTALASLDGLSGLTSVERDIGIVDNAVLTSLDGLGGPTSARNVFIRENQRTMRTRRIRLTSRRPLVRIRYHPLQKTPLNASFQAIQGRFLFALRVGRDGPRRQRMPFSW